MSRENVEIVQRLYQSMSDPDSVDLATLAECTHQDVEWVPDSRVGERPIRGRKNVLQFFLERAEVFDEVRIEVERLWESGDGVLAFIRMTGSGSASGAAFDIRIGHLWTLRDGVVVRGEGYGDRREALEAAGLSE